MGTFFRAATGILIALTLLHGKAVTTALRQPALAAIKADIASQRPSVRLETQMQQGLAGLSALIAAQIGTEGPPAARLPQARGLHS